MRLKLLKRNQNQQNKTSIISDLCLTSGRLVGSCMRYVSGTSVLESSMSTRHPRTWNPTSSSAGKLYVNPTSEDMKPHIIVCWKALCQPDIWGHEAPHHLLESSVSTRHPRTRSPTSSSAGKLWVNPTSEDTKPHIIVCWKALCQPDIRGHEAPHHRLLESSMSARHPRTRSPTSSSAGKREKDVWLIGCQQSEQLSAG